MARDQILLIDDEPNILKVLTAILEREGFWVHAFQSFDKALPVLNEQEIDLVITDLSMPVKTGFDVLEYCKNYSPDLPVILITAFGSIESAVQAMKNGAFDFISKPFEPQSLSATVKKALESRVRRKREPALEMMNASGVGPVPISLLGQEASTVELQKQVQALSQTDSLVLIEGEVGTGKRIVAFEIHRKSPRSRFPFISIHGDAIPGVFQISEIFGMEKGANPLAWTAKPGRLELASRGTLLIEEASALTTEVQLALLDAIESGFYLREGGVKRYPLEARIILTFTRGQLVPELEHQFLSHHIKLKPLRDRLSDLVNHLFPYFLERSCRRRGVPVLAVSRDFNEWLKLQKWTGNLGQLEKWTDRLVAHTYENQKNVVQPEIKLSQLVRPD